MCEVKFAEHQENGVPKMGGLSDPRMVRAAGGGGRGGDVRRDREGRGREGRERFHVLRREA